jgi:mRNA interferase MazF
MTPNRGDVWFVDLAPTRGHEQSGMRPALVLSVDLFNSGPSELVIVCPITSKRRNLRSHVQIIAPEGGLSSESYVMCDHIRSISRDRLARALGSVSDATISAVEERVRILLGL